MAETFLLHLFLFFILMKIPLKNHLFKPLKKMWEGVKKIDNSQVGLAIFEKIFGQFWPFLAKLAKFFGKMLSET